MGEKGGVTAPGPRCSHLGGVAWRGEGPLSLAVPGSCLRPLVPGPLPLLPVQGTVGLT